MKTGIELIKDIDDCIVEKGKLAFWWLGQLGYVIKLGKTVIYIDAFLSNRADRSIPPLLKPEEITNADIIMGTHDHEDHIDRKVWKQLSISSPNAKFIVPRLLVPSLSKDLDIPEDRFVGVDDGLSIHEKGLQVTGIASAHEFLDRDLDSGCYPYLGFVIEGNGLVIYHSGDTCIYPEYYSRLKQWEHFDIMFIPINGRSAARYKIGFLGNMTYQEAVDLAGYFKPSLVVPGHYEMIPINGENPSLFTDYLNVKYTGISYWLGNHGEKVLFDGGGKG